MSTGRAIVCGTLLVGILDGLDAIVFFHFWAGVAPGRIFQGIAAGLLGRTAAEQGGTATVVLGVVLHVVVAFSIVTVFVAASRRLRVLAARPVVFGIVYGLAAYAVMNFVVMPLSAIGPRTAPLPVPVLVNGLLIHVVGVGLPTAFIARAASRRARYDPIGSPA
jgi:uncharacterized membrane protein YagU involved in acid resistance